MWTGIRHALDVLDLLVLAVWAHSSAALPRAERGQTMIELGLILAVVALVAAVAIRTLGVDIREVATAAGCFLVPSNMGCSAYGG